MTNEKSTDALAVIVEEMRRTQDEHGKKLDRIVTGLTRIETNCTHRLNIIQAHGRTLYGENGRGGIVADVETALAHSASAMESRAMWNRRLWQLFVPLFVGFIMAVGAFIWATLQQGGDRL